MPNQDKIMPFAEIDLTQIEDEKMRQLVGSLLNIIVMSSFTRQDSELFSKFDQALPAWLHSHIATRNKCFQVRIGSKHI
jgi:hypothetical protein